MSEDQISNKDTAAKPPSDKQNLTRRIRTLQGRLENIASSVGPDVTQQRSIIEMLDSLKPEMEACERFVEQSWPPATVATIAHVRLMQARGGNYFIDVRYNTSSIGDKVSIPPPPRRWLEAQQMPPYTKTGDLEREVLHYAGLFIKHVEEQRRHQGGTVGMSEGPMGQAEASAPSKARNPETGAGAEYFAAAPRGRDHTEKDENILPCPFCQSKLVLAWLSHDAKPNVWCVFCENCNAEGPHFDDSKKGAIDAWNRAWAGRHKSAGLNSIPVTPETNGALLETIRGAVARGWCAPINSNKVMDGDLAEAITHEVTEFLKYPCHRRRNPAEWCDRHGLAGFMGHSCV